MPTTFMEDPLAVLSRNLRERRHALGRTQDEVAAAAGMDQSVYSRIERGAVDVRVRTLVRIALALDMDPNDLLRDICEVLVPPVEGAQQL